jgi:hypothetical protein
MTNTFVHRPDEVSVVEEGVGNAIVSDLLPQVLGRRLSKAVLHLLIDTSFP